MARFVDASIPNETVEALDTIYHQMSSPEKVIAFPLGTGDDVDYFVNHVYREGASRVSFGKFQDEPDFSEIFVTIPMSITTSQLLEIMETILEFEPTEFSRWDGKDEWVLRVWWD